MAVALLCIIALKPQIATFRREDALLVTPSGEIQFLHTQVLHGPNFYLAIFCRLFFLKKPFFTSLAVGDPGSEFGRHGAEKRQGVLSAVEGDWLKVETGPAADQSHHVLLPPSLFLSLCLFLPPTLIFCVSASPKANSKRN